jgi:hypothetical protein
MTILTLGGSYTGYHLIEHLTTRLRKVMAETRSYMKGYERDKRGYGRNT